MKLKSNEPAFLKIFYSIFPEMILNNHTYRLKKFVNSIPNHLHKDSSILDTGAGSLRYKPVFNNFNFKSQDISMYPGIDIICDIIKIPVESEVFDAVINIQVLEHLKEPVKAFQEFSRILKKGGKLFLTTHMLFPLHMIPNDYFRYTYYGLKYLAESNGFKVISIKPQGGIFAALSHIIQYYIPYLFNENQIIYYLYIYLFSVPFLIINSILLLLDLLDFSKSITLNYECIFMKE
jgi:SAM-dependent methyltransferase